MGERACVRCMINMCLIYFTVCCRVIVETDPHVIVQRIATKVSTCIFIGGLVYYIICAIKATIILLFQSPHAD